MRRWSKTAVVCAGALVTLVLVGGCATRRALAPDAWHATTDGASRVMVSHFPSHASGNDRLLEIRHELPAELLRGIPFVLHVTVRSLVDYPLETVALGIDTGTALASDSHPTPDGTTPEGRPVWRFEPLPPRETRDIRLTIVAPEGENVAFDTTVSLAREFARSLPLRRPRLDLRLEAPESIPLAHLLPVTVVVENSGDGTAREIAAEISLPEGFVATRTDAWASDKTPFPLALPDVPPGETKRLELALQAPRTGRFAIAASLRAPPDLAADATREITVVAPRLVVQAIPPSDPCPNVPSWWTFSVLNTGDAPARATMLTCELPPDVVCLAVPEGDYASGRITWNLGTIPPDEMKLANAEMLVRQPMDVAAPVELSAVGAETTNTTFEASYWHRPILTLDLQPVDSRPGVWEIAVHNTGTREALDVHVTCEVRNQIKPTSMVGATQGEIVDSRIVFDPIPKLPPRSKARWQIEFPASEKPALTVHCTARHLAEALVETN